jgi:mannose-6-phosphate isomerase
MNKLYPLKFKPIFKDRIWGGNKLKTVLNKSEASDICGESWEVADVGEDVSLVVNGFLKGNNLNELVEIYMGDLVGDQVFARFGNQFPLLIKYIHANETLSIQVHPDDHMANTRHNSHGKTEMWYILDHEPGAEVTIGFKDKVTKEQYLENLKDKTLPEILNTEKVEKGDVFFLPAGRIHAIGAGVLLIEVQQASDITYRIYDWDRVDEKGNPRQLHTDLALDAIDYQFHENYKTQYETELNKTSKIVNCQYFTVNNIQIDKPLEKDYSLIDSFVIYIAIEGKFFINPEEGNPVEVKKGECVLVPASVKALTLEPLKLAKFLEVYVGEAKEANL